ncbi:unnamed protein product [Effrenium voratum]|nr:unnamed protein product [Effrenium voratum]
MGLRLACPRRELPAAREEADSAESKAPALDSNLKAEPGDGLREELRRLETKAPLDDTAKEALRDACAGLDGSFQDGGFLIGAADTAKAAEVTGEVTLVMERKVLATSKAGGFAPVIIFNTEKGYGVLRDEKGSEAFFAVSGLDGGEVCVGDKVRYREDHSMIEGQLCAVNIRKEP